MKQDIQKEIIPDTTEKIYHLIEKSPEIWKKFCKIICFVWLYKLFV